MSSKSRFQVLTDKFGSYSIIQLKDTETGEYVSILPEIGGTIVDMVLDFNGNLKSIIDGYKSESDLKEIHESSYKSSKLFPFPNRIKDGHYSFDGTVYELKINEKPRNNAIHGLVHNKSFSLVDQKDGDTSASIILKYSYNADDTGFPFAYEFDIEYKWTKYIKFSCKTTIKNTGSKVFPYGDGWHPYFKTDDIVDNLYFQFPAVKSFKTDNRSIPTGKTTPYSEFNQLSLIGDTVFDTCFELNTEDSKAEIVIFNKKANFGYKIWQEIGFEKYNYLQIYTPDHRQSIAIEPMTCIPDAFNNGTGLIELAPGTANEISWGVGNVN